MTLFQIFSHAPVTGVVRPLRRKTQNLLLLSAPLATLQALSGCATDLESAPNPEEAEAMVQSSDARGPFDAFRDEDFLRAERLAYGVLESRLETLGIESPEDLSTVRTEIDALGMAHVRVAQSFEGVPVFGGEGIVHFGADGAFRTLTDTFLRNVFVPDTTPRLLEEDAIARAVSALGCTDCLSAAPVADLWILRHAGQDTLVYRVALERIDGSLETAMPIYFINAHTGEVVWHYDNLQTAMVTGTGTSTYYGSKSFADTQSGSTYYLEDTVRKVGVVDMKNTTTSMYRATDTDNAFTATNQMAMVDAYYGLQGTYDYYKTVFGRNGIDGNGGPAYVTSVEGAVGLITSRVHYSTRYNNAFWSGSYMTYGDGDGTTFTALTSVDITGHELTHGVTERTAGLVYSGESGALNESMSDVFGSLVERYLLGETTNTWRIGEAVYTPSNGTSDALRYMDNPHQAVNSGFTSDDDPDHYNERYTGSSDNGGVHINSGIANFAFYLLAKGGAHHLGGSMTGIGADAAGAIWYRALTVYMTSSTNFAGARTATLNAATDLYGATSAQNTAVQNAWGLVGVGTVAGGGGGGGGGTGAEMLVNGGFESSVSPWVMSGTGALYVANGTTPQAGTGYIYFGAANSVSGSTYQQFAIPSTATTATLTFYLNVTSAETTTSTQYDKLFVEARNTSGSLLSTLGTYSNLNKTTAGNYSQKSFNLLPYKGQTIRIQFRTTTDSSAITTFRVDTASVK